MSWMQFFSFSFIMAVRLTMLALLYLNLKEDHLVIDTGDLFFALLIGGLIGMCSGAAGTVVHYRKKGHNNESDPRS